MPNTLHVARNRLFACTLLLLTCAATRGVNASTRVDLSGYAPGGELQVRRTEDRLIASWPIDDGRTGVLELSLDPAKPLIGRLAVGKDERSATTILAGVNPCGVVTVGTRDLKPAGWTIFFDNPPKRSWEAFPLVIARESARVVTEAGRTSIVFEGASAGPFAGEFRFTFYPGGALVRAAAVLSTDRNATAYIYDVGLAAPDGTEAPWKAVAWTDLKDEVVHRDAADVARDEAKPVKVRNRVIAAEGRSGGSVAVVPAPHRYFYPLDFVDNLASAWCGRDYRGKIAGAAFGVRQTIEGDKRWVPWVNAPPGSKQEMEVFYLLSDGDAAKALADARAYTRNDSFAPLEGYKTFSSHYHVEHAVDFLKRQKEQGTQGIPTGLEMPTFVRRFKAMGVDAVHLAEFHLSDNDMKVADRLTRLKTLHDECARLSDDAFLLMPGEEPNVHLGGHWLSFFPRPVYWTLDRKKDQPFVEDHPTRGKVYHVGSAADVLKLMEAERGLMWTAHPRIKGSTGFPDVYRQSDYFKSDRFLGAAWKAMPADYSLPRLGSRVLDLLDDMNNWGARKQSPGEVDVFAIDADSELYAHMNVNYLKLDRMPKFADGWQPILDALRGGRFFTTTGEVLIPTFTIDGKVSGDTLKPSETPSRLRATLRWTFPLSFAEVVSGDGEKVFRQRIELTDTRDFGERDLDVSIDLRGRKWVRFEVWDIATNGAYTQPVWIE